MRSRESGRRPIKRTMFSWRSMPSISADCQSRRCRTSRPARATLIAAALPFSSLIPRYTMAIDPAPSQDSIRNDPIVSATAVPPERLWSHIMQPCIARA